VSLPVQTATASPRPFHGWRPEEVDLIRRTIAPPDATEDELALYLRLCHTYGLDPFRRELVLVKRRRRTPDGTYESSPIFITTRDGYLRAAQRDPGYAGIMSAAVHENDHFEFDVENQKIIHRFGKDRGKLIGAWAVAYHKERPPVMAYVPLAEYYNPNSDTWKTHPSAMICKVAEVYVLRRQFNLTGIVAREEIELDLNAADVREAQDAAATPTRPQLPPPNGPASRPAPQAPAQGPHGAPAQKPHKPLNPTDFWKAVRVAAASAGVSPQDWVARRADGQTDLRAIPPELARRIYEEALRTSGANGAPAGHSRPETAPDTTATADPAPAHAREPDSAHSPERSARARALATLQALWRRRKLPPEQQAAQVQAIIGGRTAIPGELTLDEINSLIDVLAGEEQDDAAPHTSDT
jgi:phage recombination protein Bet